MTDASVQALENLRDFSTIKWYVIPLLAIIFYIYTSEIKKARESGNWGAIFAGAIVFGTDFLFETINGWIFHFTQRSALWTTPGETALATTVGWNIEIMFMFSLIGIIYYNTLSEDRNFRIIGIPDRVFWVLTYAAVCVFVECLLNAGGHLVWEYPFWFRSPLGVLPIYFTGYVPVIGSAMLIISLQSTKNRLAYAFSTYGAAIILNIIGFGILGMNY